MVNENRELRRENAKFGGKQMIKMIVKKLQKELEELNDKRTKLSKFLAKPHKKDISATQFELLKEQSQAMAKYANILELRIKNLEAKNDD